MAKADFVAEMRDARVEGGALGRIQFLPTTLVLLGCLTLCASLVGDFLGISNPGAGSRQIAAGAIGAAAIIAGLAACVLMGQRSIAEISKFSAIAAQVALVAVAIYAYDIENIGFSRYLTILIFCGFIANHFIPQKWRIAFFLSLSLVGLFGVFQLKNSLILLGIGAGLIGICHLRAPMPVRITLLLAAAAVLAALRLDLLAADWSAAAMPILASMFMFRLSIYLYDIANGKGPKGWLHRFAYFFMLPNVVFPFFPVIDFSSFGRTYYNEEAVRIYERGASWMLRGLVHLLLYRVVSYYLLADPAAVSGPGDFLYYVATNFFLYLKVSGLFHLVIGILLIFGFNLPETHTRYYFSNSFIDFWRRINIFWKDYMQKMVFTPSFVALKRRGVGQNAAILISMLIVFFATWALHAYQWFWIRGSVHFSGPDTFFWGFLAVMLVVQTAYEMRRATRPRPSVPAQHLFGHRSMLVLRTAATMATIFILWSLWTSASFGEWFELIKGAGYPTLEDGATVAEIAIAFAYVIAAAFVLLIALGVTFGIGPHASEAPRARLIKPKDSPFYGPAAARLAVVAAIVALQSPLVTAPLGTRVQQFALDIGTSKLNSRDAAALERGYYEGLTDVNRFNTELWQLYSKRPTGWVDIRDTEAARFTENYLQYELRPSASIIYKGAPFQTNRWGMRDKHYSMEKPLGVFRIALIGDSRAMGYGVADPELFENLLEERLNAEFAGGEFSGFEILNFGVADYKPVQRLMVLENKALAFEPNAFIYTGHFDDFEIRHLAEAVRREIPLPYPELSAIVERSGATASMPIQEIRRRIEVYGAELMSFVFDRMAATARRENIAPIWVYLPSVKEYTAEELAQRAKMLAMAKDAGFIVIDLFGMFDGEDLSRLWVAEWDYHPNALGHRIIADRLFEALTSDSRTAELMKISRPTTDQAISQ